jgi:hypothetical protein
MMLMLAPAGAEPKSVAADKLPKEIKALHGCTPGGRNVELSSERYAKSVLFFVSCPAQERGGFEMQAVYVARDANARGAKRLTFEILAPDGSVTTTNALPSAIAARETYTKPEDTEPNRHTRNDPPWITGAWAPRDRDGVCAVVGHWRVQGEKAELWLWEEAKECPPGASPKYESRLDRKPPALVGP